MFISSVYFQYVRVLSFYHLWWRKCHTNSSQSITSWKFYGHMMTYMILPLNFLIYFTKKKWELWTLRFLPVAPTLIKPVSYNSLSKISSKYNSHQTTLKNLSTDNLTSDGHLNNLHSLNKQFTYRPTICFQSSQITQM